jgi:hypothetical protein
MAPVQTQTTTLPAYHTSQPLVLTGRISKPPTRSTRNTNNNTSKPLLSYSPQIPTAHPDIPISLLRNKLLLTCRPYIPSSLAHDAQTDGIYSRASHWITSRSLAASRHGKAKRYFVLHTDDFTFQQVSSAWEARVCAAGSRPIDAGNGVVVFVKERREWEAVMRGYRRQGKRAGELVRTKEKEVERRWREMWRGKCNSGGGEEGVGLAKEGGQGPMWYLVKSGVERIRRGEA